MEINLKQLSNQAIESTTGGKKMRLSENAQSMVFMLFTKNVYSNPIGTVVREITSNCFDSHIEAKVNPKTPVVIRKSKDKDSNQHYISFIDYGVGMSPERVENIYMVYFESTKRVDNTQIGGFGIGGKTPLAYKRSTGVGEGEYDNSFFVITIFDGIKYYYCVSEGTESPMVHLLHQEATKEHNGTEIRIPVLEKDLYTFEKEMVRQLYYFENVVFEGFENTDSRYSQTLTNNYQIVRGKTFLFRGTEYASQMHACLGRVAYPIDYATLGLNSSDYYLPVAVKLEIGEVNVTVSREQLDYSEATIKILKKKLAEAKQEITELLAKQYSNIVTLEDYFNVKNEFGKLKFANGVEVNVGNLIKQSDVDFTNFAYNFMKMPNDRQLFKFFFLVKSYGKKPARSRYSKYEFEGGYKELQQNSNLLYIDGEFVRKVVKQAYLKQEYDLYHIVEKRNLCANFMRSEIAELFNVHLDKVVDDNGKPVTFVQSLLDMQEEYMTIVRSHARDYDTIVIPDDFVARRKKKGGMSEEIRNSTIPVRFVGRYGTERVKLAHLFDYNTPIFYGGEEEEYKLNKAVEMYNALFDSKAVVTGYSTWNTTDVFSNGYTSYNRKTTDKQIKKSIMFIRLAKNNLKYMEYCKRAKKVDDFYTEMLVRKEDKVRAFFQTYDLVNSWDDVGSMYKEKNFEKISPVWYKKIKEVSDYIKALPTMDSTNIGYMKDQLSKYFDLSNVKKTAEQKRIEKMISDVKQLQKANEGVLSYINYRYDYELKDEKLVHILKKVMVL